MDLSFPAGTPNFIMHEKLGENIMSVSSEFLLLEEITKDGVVVQSENMTLISSDFSASPFSFLRTDGEGYQFFTRFDNLAAVLWQVGVFQEGNQLSFAGHSFQVEPKDLKWSILIEDWPFMSSSNSLRFMFNLDNLQDTPFNFSSSNMIVEGTTVILTNHTFMSGAFEITLILFHVAVINETTSVPIEVAINVTGDIAWISLTFPYFEGQVTYDPVYSMLLETNQNGDGGGTIVAEIVIPVVLGAALLIIIFLFIVVVVVGIVIWMKWHWYQHGRQTAVALNIQEQYKL